ncbi:MAG TPA: hypothetical protein VFR67_21695 [Pilimelia sp.]|nr:hypothetical protein [Pilimelia sp.]
MRPFRPSVSATTPGLFGIAVRFALPAVVGFGMAGGVAGAAAAQAPAPGPSGGAAAPPAAPGKTVCTISDDRMVELSGLVATADGYIAVNDSSDSDRRRRVFFLDKKCEVVEAVAFPRRALDPEDLALSADRKTLWIGDIGDNGADRQTIAVWKMPADGSKQPVIHRLSYPDGAKDAEALLVGRDGLPIIITKGAKAELYKPTGAPKKDETTPLKKVGELTLPKTSTSTPLGPLGRITVTGAAAAPDGRRVVLRTYADAFEWDVADGNIPTALTSGKPRITPLPDEPLGEAISYSADGATFLTVSETSQVEDLQPTILRYTPAKEQSQPPPVPAAAGNGDTRSWLEKLSLRDITYMVGVVGLIGLVLVLLGVVGILRARRRAVPLPKDATTGGPDDQAPGKASRAMPDAAFQQYGVPSVGTGYGQGDFDKPRSGAVYGGGTYRSGQAGGDYGHEPAGPRSGAVYGRPSGAPQRPSDAGGPARNGHPRSGYGRANGSSEPPYIDGRGRDAAGDDWFANQPAGRYPPPAPEYGDPDPRYGYDDRY